MLTATFDQVATQTERRDATRQAILSSAMKQFTDDGTSTSMESIASAAGVTKGSIHYHFGSRIGLLRAVAEYTIGQLEQRITRSAESGVEAWVRSVLVAQATPKGRMLFTIHDELAASGELADVDPFPYFTLRLAEFEIPSPPPVVAAALIQYGRQLAFGNTSAENIDDVMADFTKLL